MSSCTSSLQHANAAGASLRARTIGEYHTSSMSTCSNQSHSSSAASCAPYCTATHWRDCTSPLSKLVTFSPPGLSPSQPLPRRRLSLKKGLDLRCSFQNSGVHRKTLARGSKARAAAMAASCGVAE